MRTVDYDYIAFDAQYFLFRNYSALKSRTGNNFTVSCLPEDVRVDDTENVISTYNFTTSDLVKQFFWTIAKVIRDVYSCNRIVLLWDKAPYYKTKMLPDYKGTRVHPTQELLDEIDPISQPTEYLQMIEDIRVEQIKSEAKYWIINNLKYFGMPSVIHDGYEADDLACLFSEMTSNHSNLKSAICSADSDWMYWINDKVDWISFNKSEAWCKEDVSGECEYKDEELKINLFELKKYMDSTFYSHNDLQKTSTLGWKDFTQLYSEITSGDYSHITDVERLNLNLKSFDWFDYPEITQVREEMESALFNKIGLQGIEYWDTLSSKGFTVSKSYTENYLTTLTKESYV